MSYLITVIETMHIKLWRDLKLKITEKKIYHLL